MDQSDYNLIDIKLTLEITKIISIDKNYNMQEIKRIVKDIFSPYCSNNHLCFYISNDEIRNFENVNVIKTLNYYNSNEIIIKSKDNFDKYNVQNETVSEQFHSAQERFNNKYENPVQDNPSINSQDLKNIVDLRTKETVTHAYKNLEIIRKKLNELDATKEEYLNAKDLINRSEQIIQNSKKILNDYNFNISNKSNQSNCEYNNYETENNKPYNKRNIKCRSLNRNFTEEILNNNREPNKSRIDFNKSLVPSHKILNTKESNFNNYNLEPLTSKDYLMTNKENNESNNLSHSSLQTCHLSLQKQSVLDNNLCKNENLKRSILEYLFRCL